ncbi:MAG TPA: hypothetical protein VFY16_14085 [Gemmatimonadaceae bacterium]|nr:hypothetical protein [Gemmatimonadaceae bacterium]
MPFILSILSILFILFILFILSLFSLRWPSARDRMNRIDRMNTNAARAA